MSYQQTVQPQSEVSPGQLVERLVQYDGPPEEFLLHLLAVQCRVGNADNGAILRIAAQQQSQGHGFEVLSVFPAIEQGSTAPVWLSQAVELAPRVLQTKQPVSTPLRGSDEMYGVAPREMVALLPIWGRNGVRGVAAFVIANTGISAGEALKRLELSITLLSLYELRLTVQRRGADLKRLRKACEVLTALNDQPKYKAAAMALCNHVASAFNAERVAFGLHKGRYVKMQAMSHTEKFTRKMELVQAMESAMEESLDQDSEVLFPTPPDTPVISRSARELSQRSGNAMVLTLPLRVAGKPVGALTVERPADQPLSIEEVETLRVTADLCTARVVELERKDRWFGAKWAASSKDAFAWAVGSKHTWAKVAALAVIGVVLFALLVPGMYRVDSQFVVKATERRQIVAPFDGFLQEVRVQPDDPVQTGDLLAVLDTRDLQDQLREAVNRELSARRQAQRLEKSDKPDEQDQAPIHYTNAEAERARADYLKLQIERANIRATVDGIVMVGDLTKQINSPLKEGDAMFEIAPRNFHAELKVAEKDIADVQVGQKGNLATLARPGEYIPIEVTRIDPLPIIEEQENVYIVRVRMLAGEEQMRFLKAGQTGVAKIDIEKRTYADIWTRELINWIRMKLWL